MHEGTLIPLIRSSRLNDLRECSSRCSSRSSQNKVCRGSKDSVHFAFPSVDAENLLCSTKFFVDSDVTLGVCPLSMLFPDLPEPTKKTVEEARRSTRSELKRAAYDAVRTLRAAMRGDADITQVRAAQVVLDRSGFGPHASLAVDDRRDLSTLSHDQLLARAELVKKQIERMNDDDVESESNASSVH